MLEQFFRILATLARRTSKPITLVSSAAWVRSLVVPYSFSVRVVGSGQVGFLFVYKAVHNKVISDFQALRQARVRVAALEPATEGSLQISGRTR
ncbi:hypothetical protein PoB_006033500 [Plakobranchus ocellatus]|uniref:Uncharacterized protein n=1 Tax=Plakobranchus ocellatus TaxID=259542 RepID=A0AAV4CPS3_9GAST|nr:hypothetical protein PoB_006033500 [Plakobranchus ocellatus]